MARGRPSRRCVIPATARAFCKVSVKPGLAAAARWFPPPEGWVALLGWILPAACLGGATVLAVAASWVPAQLAGATDPAEVLLKEGG